MLRMFAKASALSLLCLNLAAQDTSLQLEYALAPTYPARRALIQGKVEIQFRIDGSGATTSVEVLSGHPRLAHSAEQAVKTWRFAHPANGFSDSFHNTTFEFSYSSRDEGSALSEWQYAGALVDASRADPNIFFQSAYLSFGRC
jgi:TonB family protein